MSGPRSLVSGGTGFVGRFIIETLLAAGHHVVVAGRTPPAPGFFSRETGFARLDLGSEAAPDLFDRIDFFVHAAFDHVAGRYRGGEGGDPDGFRRRNLDAAITFFEAAKAAGVRRTVFLSSRAVYGQRPSGTRLNEDDDPHPDTLYGEVKLGAERALAAMAGEAFATASLRITGVYGPAAPGGTHKWRQLFSDYLDGQPIAPRAGTEVHGEDVGRAVMLMLTAPPEAVSGRIFNVSDILVDRHDILSIVREATGSRQALPQPADKAAVNVMETQRLATLGWRPGGMQLFRRTVAKLAEDAAAAAGGGGRFQPR